MSDRVSEIRARVAKLEKPDPDRAPKVWLDVYLDDVKLLLSLLDTHLQGGPLEPDRGALCEHCDQWEYNEDGSCRTFMVCGACWNAVQRAPAESTRVAGEQGKRNCPCVYVAPARPLSISDANNSDFRFRCSSEPPPTHRRQTRDIHGLTQGQSGSHAAPADNDAEREKF